MQQSSLMPASRSTAPAAQPTKLPVLPGWLLDNLTIKLSATPLAACILAL